MWLALDTATDRASVAVGGATGTPVVETIVGARRHAAGLLPAIERCLSGAGAGFADLEGVVMADGPGSFTGLRVGAALVQALLRVRPIPWWTTPSLMVLAAGDGPGSGPVLAVSNALRGDLFMAVYAIGTGAITTLTPPTVVPIGEVLRRTPAGARVVGPAAATLGGTPTWPDAGVMLRLVGTAGALRRLSEGSAWEPDYGRPAEAQAKWEREHGRVLEHPTGNAR
jgi:tRNA threonylcarbamoyladenosine biosynthesis protein TsaB